MTSEKEVKDALHAGKVVIGKGAVTRQLKQGSLESVFLATNCPAETVKSLEYYAGVSKVSADRIGRDSARLGLLCGKPFNVTVIGIKK